MRLFLARHAETNYNVRGLLSADKTVDVHLTDLGIKQAQLLKKRLETEQIEVIFISELLRTKQTADIVNKDRKLKVITDKRINDTASGFEGKLYTDFLQYFNTIADKWNTNINGDESLQDVKNRVLDFLQYLKQSIYTNALIITSSIILECIYGVINDSSFEESSIFKIEQGDFVTLDY